MGRDSAVVAAVSPGGAGARMVTTRSDEPSVWDLRFRSTTRSWPGVVVAFGVLLAGGCVKTSENLCGDDPSFDPACPDDDDDVAGDDDDDDDDDMADAGPPCGGCEGDTPVCDEASDTCVGCLRNSDCEGPDAGFCDDDTNTCVACTQNVDCPEVTAPRCDPTGLTCGDCASDADCERFSDTPTCSPDGTCVACTPGSAEDEAAACDGNSCDAATSTCTETPVSSVARCGACQSDAECADAEDFCVPMFFMDAPRDSAYCLKSGTIGGGGCVDRPFSTATEERTSLGGRVDRYCSINEATTTCEAFLDLAGGAPGECATDDECGAESVADARCEEVSLAAGRCTYSCTVAFECPTAFPCNNGYCGG